MIYYIMSTAASVVPMIAQAIYYIIIDSHTAGGNVSAMMCMQTMMMSLYQMLLREHDQTRLH